MLPLLPPLGTACAEIIKLRSELVAAAEEEVVSTRAAVSNLQQLEVTSQPHHPITKKESRRYSHTSNLCQRLFYKTTFLDRKKKEPLDQSAKASKQANESEQRIANDNGIECYRPRGTTVLKAAP
jgi:predicted amidophosphoribosyltransferase